ncbi:putative plastidic glucose transporter 1 [Cocos nucifera]|uniref:Putative plastidic glucose transporter 1 n=1 Tax=Cocos nucifera TaxID=13894 RepID=A0A8K0HVD5_COCNU|nr:putative plastidic glucose transporter 1 [Cocos nucifera]
MQSSAILYSPYPKSITTSPKPKGLYRYPLLPKSRKCVLGFKFPPQPKEVFKLSATNEPPPSPLTSDSGTDGDKPSPSQEEEEEEAGGIDLSWLPAFPHVLTASMSNFLFGYHIGQYGAQAPDHPVLMRSGPFVSAHGWLMNGPIVAIARELGFEGNSFLEGLVIDTIPLILGALLSAQAHSLDEMLWGRFLVGLGIGVNTVLVPLYISEVSPTKHRGSLGTLCQIGTCLGIIAALSIGIPSESDPHWWRTILYIASAPGFILMFGMQFAVESPRWLFAFIGWSLFILQQFAGINGVLYFSSLTFQDVGITDGALASLFVGITHLAGALFALYLMDKQGRQRLLIGSYMGMACSMFLIVYAISFSQDEGLSHSLSVLGTIMVIGKLLCRSFSGRRTIYAMTPISKCKNTLMLIG